MRSMVIHQVTTFHDWRNAARPLLGVGMAAENIEWAGRGELASRPQAPAPQGDVAQSTASGTATQGDVAQSTASGAATQDTATPSSASSRATRPVKISASLLRLLETIAMYRDAGRWELMYRLALRAQERSSLLQDSADRDVRAASLMERAVNRDVHKMHAFVRFREITDATGDKAYFAWFEPEHEILRRGANFFVKRFANMRWTIATPDGAAVWDLRDLNFIDPPIAAARPVADEYEGLWRTYYRSICNVARLKPTAMQREMPRRYWKHLPEAVEIDGLIRDGLPTFLHRQRESSSEGNIMAKAVKHSLPLPASDDESPKTCRRCDLWKNATQAVEGEGAPQATIMLVGEQPGDEEDLRGHPFVGPAGKVLDQAMAAAGLDRKQIFITNAVKHFKWEPRGKRRLHKKPGVGEINACHIWLEHEIAAVKPSVIVALGGTALRALTGVSLSIESARQQELRHADGARILATYHPSAILRAEGDRVEELRGHLEGDLRTAARSISREGT